MKTLIRLQEQSDLGLHCLHTAFCQKLWQANSWTFTIHFFDLPVLSVFTLLSPAGYTHFSLVTLKRIIGKQCIPTSDATKCGI